MSERNEMIVNELLTFLQNKLDIIDELSLVQICVSNYSDNEVEAAKTIVFDLIPDGSRCVIRKGDDKKKKNIKDILRLLKETDPDKHPVFVAKNLNRLPPVTFDHVDVSRLLKDLTLLKAELKSLREDSATKEDIMQVQHELKQLSLNNKSLTNALHLPATVNSRSKTQRPSPLTSHQASGETEQRALSHSAPPPPMPPATSPQPVFSGDEITRALYTPSYRDIITRTSLSQRSEAPKQSANELSVNDNGEKDFITVVHKKRKKILNIRGTLENSHRLRVAETLSAIYVSRFTKDITEVDIKGHVSDMGEECHSVTLLKQNRATSFNSFKIEVPSCKINKFLSGEFWPVGLVFRRYKERYLPRSYKNQDG